MGRPALLTFAHLWSTPAAPRRSSSQRGSQTALTGLMPLPDHCDAVRNVVRRTIPRPHRLSSSEPQQAVRVGRSSPCAPASPSATAPSGKRATFPPRSRSWCLAHGHRLVQRLPKPSTVLRKRPTRPQKCHVSRASGMLCLMLQYLKLYVAASLLRYFITLSFLPLNCLIL